MHALFKVMDKCVYGLMVHVIIDNVNMHLNHIQHINNVKNMVIIVQPMEEDVLVIRNVLNINIHRLVYKVLMVLVHYLINVN